MVKVVFLKYINYAVFYDDKIKKRKKRDTKKKKINKICIMYNIIINKKNKIKYVYTLLSWVIIKLIYQIYLFLT